MTLEQVKQLKHGQEVHYSECKVFVGPRGGEIEKTERWRVSGMVKTWKTRPMEAQVPIKHGMYDNSYITERNMAMFHPASECKPKREVQS